MVPTIEERVREFVLSLPGAVEEYPWGQRVAKAGRKVLVTLGPEGRAHHGQLRDSHVHAMTMDGAAPTGHGLGRSGGERFRCEWRA